MDKRLIIQPYVYTQSFQKDELDNPVMYSESFTISKISVSGLEKIYISNIKNFTGNAWKKTSTNVQPKLGFILGNDLEYDYFDPDYLWINPKDIDLFQPATREDIELNTAEQKELPYRLIYREVPIVTVEDFYLRCAYNGVKRNLYNFPILKEVSNVLDTDLVLNNQDSDNYLYLIIYSPSLMRGEISYQGNIQFSLWGE